MAPGMSLGNWSEASDIAQQKQVVLYQQLNNYGYLLNLDPAEYKDL